LHLFVITITLMKLYPIKTENGIIKAICNSRKAVYDTLSSMSPTGVFHWLEGLPPQFKDFLHKLKDAEARKQMLKVKLPSSQDDGEMILYIDPS
jgi:hypothetical protein